MVTSSSGVTLAAKRLISIKRSVKGISRRRSSNTCFKASLCEAAVNTVAVPGRKRASRNGASVTKASCQLALRALQFCLHQYQLSGSQTGNGIAVIISGCSDTSHKLLKNGDYHVHIEKVETAVVLPVNIAIQQFL